MKKLFCLACGWLSLNAAAQEHYSGISTSQRKGIINAGVNPAELANLDSKFDIHVISTSVKASNSELGFGDLVGGGNFTDKLFAGNTSVDLRLDGEITGPGIAWRMDKWGFAFTTKAYARLDLVAVDANLGDALTNSAIDAFYSGASVLSNANNQRLAGTSWGEIALSGARILYEDSSHKLNLGASVKILFPGSYANFGAERFSGTITNDFGQVSLTNAQANLNIAYSGNLGDDFSQLSDYTGALFGKPNGLAADIGVNYQWKDTDEQQYKLNVGVAVRNIGAMTFKSRDNADTHYVLSVQGNDTLNLNQFQNAKSLKEVEAILLGTGFLNKAVNERKSFKVVTPTYFTAYADVKIVPSFYLTAFTQLKMRKDDENGQIAGQNVFSLTPRYTTRNIEVYLPVSSSEISGFATGVGFRAYGFFIGSGSVITALLADAKQADAYIGYGFQLD